MPLATFAVLLSTGVRVSGRDDTARLRLARKIRHSPFWHVCAQQPGNPSCRGFCFMDPSRKRDGPRPGQRSTGTRHRSGRDGGSNGQPQPRIATPQLVPASFSVRDWFRVSAFSPLPKPAGWQPRSGGQAQWWRVGRHGLDPASYGAGVRKRGQNDHIAGKPGLG